jgi:hypothetical protein
MAEYRFTIDLTDWAELYPDAETLENKLMDLMRTAVLPTLELNPYNYKMTKKRG